MHPAAGPVAEADILYVRQLRLCERMVSRVGEFVVWDVGLGAAANALAVFRATQDLGGQLRLVSFDETIEPLRFGLEHSEELGFLAGYEPAVQQLVARRQVSFTTGAGAVTWQLELADFPALLAGSLAPALPKPDAILFDPYSPARNPAMWTLRLFTDLFRLLDPERPCALATYSRSTMTRVALLRAGFFVGRGEASGRKEETTIAANACDLIGAPLDRRWLERARRSHSAEPLRNATYTQLPLSPGTWEHLQAHPQFR